jgi:tetratricopeptide (TPR) repeat protein
MLFAILATLAFYLLLEFVLLVIGVTPASQQSDPTAGFNKHSRLFTESQKSVSNVTTVETAKNRLNFFNYQSFPRDKPLGAYRVFCMGGSTTYGRPYNDKTSFSGFLRAFLPEMDSSRQWEVINAGAISYASYRIEILTRELTNYEPDLFVIYTGHNEFLEDRTYSSLIATPAPIKSVFALASKSRTFSLLRRMVDDPTPTGDSRVLPEEVDALLDRSVGPSAYHRDDQWRKQVLENFRPTLERIVDLAAAANAKVIFVVPACNLRDCAPFKSEHRGGLTTAELREFMVSFHAGQEALKSSNLREALRHFDDAIAIDERYAAAHFFRGQALLKLDDVSAARDAFLRAREEDVCPLRALEQIQQIVHDIATDRKLPLIDFATIIDQRSEHNIPGADWFLDHVHPTIAGHELLARELANELGAERVVHPSESWTSDSFDQISQQLKSHIDPREHAIALRNLAKVLSWAGKTDEADRLAQQAVEQLSDDEESQTMAGFAKLRLNQIAAAKAHFEAALRVQPNDARALGGLGDVYTRQGELEAARDCFMQAIAADPKHVPAHFNLGNTLRSLGQLNQAADCYRRALELAPDQPDTHKNLGLVLIAQGDIEATVHHFEKAMALEDYSPGRHADLGFVLIDAGEPQRASAEFQAALAIDPAFVAAIFGMALLSERSGDLTRASELLQDALRIAPNDVNLHYNLARHALQLGDSSMAEQELNVVIKLDPNHRDAIRLLAELRRQSQ